MSTLPRPPLNYAFPTFIPGKFRIPPDFKLWPEAFYPDLKAANLPQTPPIPPQVATGEVITSGHENTVTTSLNDLWINEQWLAAHSIIDPTTAVGDVVVRGPSGVTALPVGANGTVLTADNTQPNYLKWATLTAAGIGAVPSTRQVIAGVGMTGGGALSADVTLTAIPMHASGAGHSAGTVPDPGATAGATHFLREDAAWTLPPVTTVFGRSGAVFAAAGDYTAAQVTNAVSATAGTANYVPIFTSAQALGNSGIYQSGSGNVLIGTTTVNAQLGVLTTPGSTGVGIYAGANGQASTQYVIEVNASGAVSASTGVYVTVSGATNNYGVRIVNPPAGAGNYAIYADATAQSYFAGNVGIQNGNPQSALYVNGAAGMASATAWTEGLVVSTAAANGQVLGLGCMNAAPWGCWIQVSHVAKGGVIFPLALQPAGGNVGIGSTSPAAQLHVYGLGSANPYYANGDATGSTLYLQDTGTSGNTGGQILFGSSYGIFAGIKGLVQNGTGPAGDLIFCTRTTTGNVVERMRVMGAGNVGIGGIVTPTYQLQLSTDSAAKPATATWTVASDARLKRNIRDLAGGLSIIEKLHLIEGEYNGLGGMPEGLRVVGLLAHELRAILPAAVGSKRGKLAAGDEETDILDLNFHEVLMHLILAVQQLAVKCA